MQPPTPDYDPEPEPHRDEWRATLPARTEPDYSLTRRVWNPVPVSKPRITNHFDRLTWPERSAETVQYAILSAEYWLSPNGSLRAWIRLNILLAVVLTVSGVLIVPPIQALLEGVRDWAGLVSATVVNINTAVDALPPIVLAIATAYLAVKLVQRYLGDRRAQSRRPYDHYQ